MHRIILARTYMAPPLCALTFMLTMLLSAAYADIFRQENALLLFKDAMEDTAGALKSWLPQENNACSGAWRGVDCNEDGTSVVGLTLEGDDLAGPIPDNIRHLTFLRNLTIRKTSFMGEIPLAIADLRNLKNLIIASNPMLSGLFPQWALNLTNLETLNLSIPSTLPLFQSTLPPIPSDNPEFPNFPLQRSHNYTNPHTSVPITHPPNLALPQVPDLAPFSPPNFSNSKLPPIVQLKSSNATMPPFSQFPLTNFTLLNITSIPPLPSLPTIQNFPPLPSIQDIPPVSPHPNMSNFSPLPSLPPLQDVQPQFPPMQSISPISTMLPQNFSF